MAKRIQRKRTKGWRMPPNAVYVGRPTKWGNPFRVEQTQFGWKVMQGDVVVKWTMGWSPESYLYALQEMIEKYSQWVEERATAIPHYLKPLRGKDLACWCPLDQPCHADVLLEMTNAQEVSSE